jgi:hypothetical protein
MWRFLDDWRDNVLMQTETGNGTIDNGCLSSALFTFFLVNIAMLAVWLLLPIYMLLVLLRSLILLIKREPTTLEGKMLKWERSISSKKSLELYGLARMRSESLDEFILNFVEHHRRYYSTVKAGTTKVVCWDNKRRSAGDIYLICKYYYPKCTVKEVMKVLTRLISRRAICGSYCNTIHKYVFYTFDRNPVIYDSTEYGNGITFNQVIDYYGRVS